MKKLIITALERIQKRKMAFGFGAAGATQALSSFFGISLVTHSSGGVLLSAGSGYIAGTFISASVVALFWILLPLTIVIGLAAYFRIRLLAAFDWFVKKVYFWRNPQ